MPDETEFKLRAERPVEIAAIDASLREAGVESSLGRRCQLVDVYLDDGRRSLTRAGIGLRLRRSGDRGELCCKQRGRSSQGLFVRPEFEASWPHADSPASAALLPPSLRDQVEPFVLDRPLEPVLRLETQRELRHVRAHELELCELAIDRVEAVGGGRTTGFFELELEVVDDLPGNEQLAGHLQQALALRPADDDKPTHSALRLGLPWPELPAAPAADSDAATAVSALFERQLCSLREAERRVRESDQAESLHGLRLEVRRLRALVRAFAPLWPDATARWLREQLTLACRRFGSVRDLDVQVAALPDLIRSLPAPLQAAAPGLREWLAAEREAARRELLGWLSDASRLAQEGELERRLLERPAVAPANLAVRFAAAAQAAIARAARRTRKRLRELDLGDAAWLVHELRIAGRDLRYLVEALPVAANGDTRVQERLGAMLQALGTVRDHELGSARVLAWLARGHGPEARTPLTAACLGGLATRHAALARKARKAARRLVERFDRKRTWRALLGD